MANEARKFKLARGLRSYSDRARGKLGYDEHWVNGTPANIMKVDNAGELIQKYWLRYLDSLPAAVASKATFSDAFAFGDWPEMADELGMLVLVGIKQATCSSLREYAVQKEPTPRVGQLSIVLDGHRRPLCVIETTRVEIARFCEISEEFASLEGEGDRSLRYWRDQHRQFFERMDPDNDFDELMPLVCQYFRRIFPE